MRRTTVAAASLLLAAATQPAGAANLGGLLEKLAPNAAAKPKGDVAVTGWVESGRDGATELVVRLETRGGAKIVAEPGVTVTPAARDGVAWMYPELVHEVAGQGYLDPPVELRLPFAADRAGPVEARVDYAYCLVDYQCLFGEATVRAEAAGR